jgi:serine/threonine protein kinase
MTVRKLATGTTKQFLRERLLLEKLPSHENIIRLVEVCNQPFQVNGVEKYTEYFIFEFAEHELASIINQKIIYDE